MENHTTQSHLQVNLIWRSNRDDLTKVRKTTSAALTDSRKSDLLKLPFAHD